MNRGGHFVSRPHPSPRGRGARGEGFWFPGVVVARTLGELASTCRLLPNRAMDGAANFMDCKSIKFGVPRKRRFSGDELKKPRDGLFRYSSDEKSPGMGFFCHLVWSPGNYFNVSRVVILRQSRRISCLYREVLRCAQDDICATNFRDATPSSTLNRQDEDRHQTRDGDRAQKEPQLANVEFVRRGFGVGLCHGVMKPSSLTFTPSITCCRFLIRSRACSASKGSAPSASASSVRLSSMRE